jgi:hypothetical protein
MSCLGNEELVGRRIDTSSSTLSRGAKGNGYLSTVFMESEPVVLPSWLVKKNFKIHPPLLPQLRG